MRVMLFAITVLPLLSVPAMAQDPEEAEEVVESTQARPAGTLDFRGDESLLNPILGDLSRPSITVLTNRQTVELTVEPTFEVDLVKEIQRSVRKAPF